MLGLVECHWNLDQHNNGLGGEIRTPDPLVPNQMRYQTALRQVIVSSRMHQLSSFYNHRRLWPT